MRERIINIKLKLLYILKSMKRCNIKFFIYILLYYLSWLYEIYI